MKTSSLLLAAALTFAAAPVAAQTHELRSGEVLIGRVASVDADYVELKGREGRDARRVRRDELAPTALYRILRERAAPRTVDDYVAVAEQASRLGLELHAIAELRAARARHPDAAAYLDRRIARLRERIAEKIAGQTRDLLERERPAAARLHAQVLLHQYADTEPGRHAEQLMTRALTSLRESAGRPVDGRALERALEHAQKDVARADKVGVRFQGAVRFDNATKQRHERAVRHLERAWKRLGDVRPATTVDAALSDRFVQLRNRVRDRLGEHYLALGNVLVQRLALPKAEEYNARACALDPHGGGCKLLQSRIIAARIARGGFGY
ncbi:MAG: hypothetical protein ACON4Z_16735 [Planctomycetota bacterium]